MKPLYVFSYYPCFTSFSHFVSILVVSFTRSLFSHSIWDTYYVFLYFCPPVVRVACSLCVSYLYYTYTYIYYLYLYTYIIYTSICTLYIYIYIYSSSGYILVTPDTLIYILAYIYICEPLVSPLSLRNSNNQQPSKRKIERKKKKEKKR